jgi:hypothetical protein
MTIMRSTSLSWTLFAGPLLAATLAGCGNSSPLAVTPPVDPEPEPTGPRLTIVVLVVDSLMPQEIGTLLAPTPALNDFSVNGTFYEESRSVFFAETIPNHVAMMTGVYPLYSSIPANAYWNRHGEPSDSDLSLPSELTADTLFTTIKRECPNLHTASVLSKGYLYEIFSACGFSGTDCGRNVQADYHFDPTSELLYLPSPIGLTPDLITANAALGALPNADFIFINLGEVDRIGHIDETGITGIPLLRQNAILRADILINLLIQSLQSAGRWERTVMFVVSDHGMDYSLPTSIISLQPTLDGLGGLFAIQNGGTDAIYLTDTPTRGHDEGYERLKAAREAVLNMAGVDRVWYAYPNPLDPGNELPATLVSGDENIGDLVVTAQDGWRFSEPDILGNPIPGNHGHLPTLRNTFIVGGGAPFIRRQRIAEPDSPVDPLERRPAQSENVDVAPTVAWLLGLPAESRNGLDGYDGRVLREAFDLEAPPSRCGVLLGP